MALVTSGLRSTIPTPGVTPKLSVLMEDGQRWADKHKLGGNVLPVDAGEIGYTLATVGDSPELHREWKRRLNRAEVDNERKARAEVNLKGPKATAKEKRKRGRLVEKLDVRVSEAERTDLEQWAERTGKKPSEFVRDAIDQAIHAERVAAVEKQRERGWQR